MVAWFWRNFATPRISGRLLRHPALWAVMALTEILPPPATVASTPGGN